MRDRSPGRTPCKAFPRMDLDLDIARDLRAPAQARRAITPLGDRLDPEVLADTRLVVSELVSNAVKYGVGEILLRVRTRGTHHVLIEVVDDGDGFSPVVRTASRFGPAGFGLKLVDELASRWGVHEGTAHVWCEIDRSADLAEAA
jgi:signal transduction histidine kinase